MKILDVGAHPSRGVIVQDLPATKCGEAAPSEAPLGKGIFPPRSGGRSPHEVDFVLRGFGKETLRVGPMQHTPE